MSAPVEFKAIVQTAEGSRKYKLPIGATIGSARNEQAKKSQTAPAKQAYDAFMQFETTGAMKSAIGTLDDDELKQLSEVTFSFKTSNARVVAARNTIIRELADRGIDPKKHGYLGGAVKLSANPKKVASKGTASAAAAPKKKRTGRGRTSDTAFRREAYAGEGYIDVSEGADITDAEVAMLKASGWKGRAGDSKEALYPPVEPLSSREDYALRAKARKNKGRIVLTDDISAEMIARMKASGWTAKAGDGAEALYPPASTKADDDMLEIKARFERLQVKEQVAIVDEDGVDAVEIDVTDELTDDELTELFSGMEDGEWARVDRVLDAVDGRLPWPTDDVPDVTTAETKAGGSDRNRGGADKLRRYWTVGAGGAKIGWKTSGDFTRCVGLLRKHLGKRAEGYCALRHKEQTGVYPGDKRNK